MDNLSQFVPNVHFEQIPIKNLVSNQDYQRDLSLAHITKAAENFDLYQINPVKVSRRDGINYVFNGQHTIEIVARVSQSRDTPVWCMIYDDLDYQQEADIFANQQKFIKPLLPVEIFQANIEAGNEDQLVIRSLLESYGLKIGMKRGPGAVNAISTVERIYKKFGYHILDRTIRLIIGTWEGEINSFKGNIINGVNRLVVVYGKELDDTQFKEKLGEVSIKALSRAAKERRAGSLGYSEVMVLTYNGKKKGSGKLKLEKLYNEKSIFNVLNRDDYGERMAEEKETGLPQTENSETNMSPDKVNVVASQTPVSLADRDVGRSDCSPAFDSTHPIV